jgi:hypothetical protein
VRRWQFVLLFTVYANPEEVSPADRRHERHEACRRRRLLLHSTTRTRFTPHILPPLRHLLALRLTLRTSSDLDCTSFIPALLSQWMLDETELGILSKKPVTAWTHSTNVMSARINLRQHAPCLSPHLQQDVYIIYMYTCIYMYIYAYVTHTHTHTLSRMSLGWHAAQLQHDVAHLQRR